MMTNRIRMAGVSALGVMGYILCSTAVASPPANGLKLWLKSDAGISPQVALSQWDDQSAYSNNAVQSTTNLMPLVVNMNVGRQQGYPVIHCQNSGLAFTLTNAASFSGFSVFYVASRGPFQNNNANINNGGDAEEDVLGSGGADTGGERSQGIRWAFGMGSDAYGLGLGGNNSPYVSLGQTNLNASRFYILSYALTRNTGWTVLVGTNSMPAVTDTNFPTGDFHGVVGCEKISAMASPLSGDIAEILVYDRTVAGSDWQQTYDYLNQRYFTTGSVTSPPAIGLRLWLKSDTGLHTNTVSSASPSLWSDQSGCYNHAVQGLMPMVSNMNVGVHAGYPAVHFATNSLVFTLTNAASYGGFSLFYVASRGPAQSADEIVVRSQGSGSLQSPGIRWGFGMGSSASDGFGWGQNDFGYTNADASTFYIRSYVLTKNTGWTLRQGTNTLPTKAETSFPTGDFNGAIGGETGIAAYPLTGDIAEILIYNRDVITDGDWQQVYQYLYDRYFSVRLPTGTRFILR